MPIYVYECRDEECDCTFEVRQSYSDNPIDICPQCGKSTLYKVIGNVNAHYKGAGFYTTESRGITGRKRKPEIKVGLKGDLPLDEQEKMSC